jgi:hypothetical protein
MSDTCPVMMMGLGALLCIGVIGVLAMSDSTPCDPVYDSYSPEVDDTQAEPSQEEALELKADAELDEFLDNSCYLFRDMDEDGCGGAIMHFPDCPLDPLYGPYALVKDESSGELVHYVDNDWDYDDAIASICLYPGLNVQLPE